MWRDMNTLRLNVKKTLARASIGICYVRFWLGLIGVFPRAMLEFHKVNFSAARARRTFAQA
jgi:hypothetical protein